MRGAFIFFLAIGMLYPVASGALWKKGGGANSIEPGETLAPNRIRSSWGRKLNPSGAIPNSGFKAIYFDRNNPGSVVAQESVDNVAIKYSWSDFHNINSKNFGAYWVGRLQFSEGETKQISVSQSWAKSRILIDGETVFDGSSNESFSHYFSPGEHIVEVEYINNWHTVEYKVTIGDPVAEFTEADVGDFFSRRADRTSRLYYVGLYESSAKDTGVNISLPSTGRPVILWLTSYEAIDWKVSSPDPISAVVLSSYSPGSRVVGVGGAAIVSVPRGLSIYSEVKRCSCSAGHFHCEDSGDLGDIVDKLEATTKLKLAAYAVRYSAEFLTVQPYGRHVADRIGAQKEANLAAQKQCRQHADPNFDTLMDQ